MATEQNTTQNTPNARDRKTYTVGQLAVERAKVRGIDTSRAAKEIRGRLRANFDHVSKLDPSIRKAKENANDGNRWPAMNAKVREFVLSTRAAKSASK